MMGQDGNLDHPHTRRPAHRPGESSAGESRNGAEFQANRCSPSRMLLFGPNSAPGTDGTASLASREAGRLRTNVNPTSRFAGGQARNTVTECLALHHPTVPSHLNAFWRSGLCAFQRRSEFLLERTDFEFHGPRARILVREMPVGLCDCFGLEKVAVLQARL